MDGVGCKEQVQYRGWLMGSLYRCGICHCPSQQVIERPTEDSPRSYVRARFDTCGHGCDLSF